MPLWRILLIKNEKKEMKKIYLNPENEVVTLNTGCALLAGSGAYVPGEEGGEMSGDEKTSDEGLDDLLGG